MTRSSEDVEIATSTRHSTPASRGKNSGREESTGRATHARTSASLACASTLSSLSLSPLAGSLVFFSFFSSRRGNGAISPPLEAREEENEENTHDVGT